MSDINTGILQPGLSEETDQILFVNWVHREYGELWEWLHHSPNGKRRTKSEGAKLKLMGVKKGFPDLVLIWPTAQHVGLAIEMKLGKGRPTKEQKAWAAHFTKCGWRAEVATLQNAKRIFIEYVKEGTP